jgi:hypothetical protein
MEICAGPVERAEAAHALYFFHLLGAADLYKVPVVSYGDLLTANQTVLSAIVDQWPCGIASPQTVRRILFTRRPVARPGPGTMLAESWRVAAGFSHRLREILAAAGAPHLLLEDLTWT